MNTYFIIQILPFKNLFTVHISINDHIILEIDFIYFLHLTDRLLIYWQKAKAIQLYHRMLTEQR